MSQVVGASRGADHRSRRKWFLVLGVCLLLLGAAGAGAASLLEVTFGLVFAPLMITSGILQIVVAFLAEKGREVVLHLVAAAIEMTFGFFVMADPLRVGVSVTALVAIFLVMAAIARL